MHLSGQMKDITKGKILQEMVRYDRLSVHRSPVSASLLARLRPHSVTCFRLLWSGHRSTKNIIADGAPKASYL